MTFQSKTAIVFFIMAFLWKADDTLAQQVEGFREVVVSVYDLPRATQYWRKVAGYEIRARAKNRQCPSWGNVPYNEVLLGNPGDTTGMIRLVKFKNTAQRHIRAGAKTWDSGGILDLNIRVKDINQKLQESEQQGWNAFSMPVRYQFGQFDVSETLLKGPDGVELALIQRHSPPLEGWPNLREFSHIFNSSQIVKNINTALDFYQNKLGWKIYMKSITKGQEGENVLGIPHNINPNVTRHVYILHPNAQNQGSVELIHLEGLTGKDFSENATPPNLGILTLRFPVKDIDTYAKQLCDRMVALEIQPTTMHLKPYGKVKLMALQAPDGAWLEFFEEIR
ncbi:MAG: VOC family protein [Runella sp.]